MEDLRSVRNDTVKDIVRLHRAAGRRSACAFIIEGRRAIAGMMAAGRAPERILVQDGHEVPADWPVHRLCRTSAEVARKISQASSPCGYAAIFPQVEPAPLDRDAGGLVCAQVQDPGNLGTLLRSAAAFGCRQIVLIGGVDPFNHKCLQSSAGVLPHLAVHRFDDRQGLQPVVDGAPLAGLVVRGGVPVSGCRTRRRWLVVGNEAHGIPEAWYHQLDQCLTLRMEPGVESLNAGIAGAIALAMLYDAGSQLPESPG